MFEVLDVVLWVLFVLFLGVLSHLLRVTTAEETGCGECSRSATLKKAQDCARGRLQIKKGIYAVSVRRSSLT